MGTPILGYSPGGGVGQPVPLPPLPGTGITNAGLTQLVIGQSYIDVVFDHYQVDNTWIFVECSVLNTTDANPLNIWTGITTSKLTTGFRLQLNGLPDSNNYFLDWAISGINIAPTPATTFILTGPASGGVAIPATFTVHLPSSTTGTATITPSDSGGGGAFSPTSVTLSTGLPSTTFTYTPASAGTKMISVTNNGGLLNPANLSFLAINYATGYSLSGPSSGTVSVASSPFTVTLTPIGYAVPSTVTITPSDGGGGGAFTPTTVALTTGAPSATFTYTPASAGAKTISTTNNGGLTDPGSLTYTASAPLSFLDNFTGASTLVTHTADTGQTWDALFLGSSVGLSVGAGVAYYSISTSGPDCTSSYTPANANTEATITISKGVITGAPEIGMWLRFVLGTSGYMGRYSEGSGFQFYRLDPGPAYTQLGSNVAGSIADNDLLRFTVAGTGATVTLTIYKNGSSVATATDTSGSRIVTTGKIGIHIYDPITGAGNYRAKDISSP